MARYSWFPQLADFGQKDLFHVRCRLCKNTPRLGAMKSTLIQHVYSKKHKNACKTHNERIVEDFREPSENAWNRKIAIAELKYAAMIVSLNFAFRISSRMAVMLDNIDPDSIFRFLKVGSTKVRNIAVKVIAEVAKLELAKVLREANFAISVDESTDSGKDKILVIIVRYVDSKTGRVMSKTWDMPKVFLDGKEADSGAESILKCIITSFKDYNIPMENIFACSTDGCSTMLGDAGGLKGLLQKKFPHILWIACPAHVTHLCASRAIQVLPKGVIELIVNLHTMVRSAHRKKNFENIQKALGLPTHKIPRFITTRWLSLGICVNRALQQWRALLVYSFILKEKNEKIGADVYNAMVKPEMKLYFYLIQNVFGELNNLNKLYQCKDVVIPICADQAEKTFKKLVSRFIDFKKVCKQHAADINIFDEETYLQYRDLQFGENLREIINIYGENLEDFLKVAYKFISVVCIEMRTRYKTFQDDTFSAFKCVNPPNSLSAQFHRKNDHLFNLYLQKFSFLIKSKQQLKSIYDQWDMLPLIGIVTPNMPIDEFWYSVYNMQDEDGNYMFTDLANIVLISLATPHSNVEPERKFSDMNVLKSKIKSCMKPEVTKAILIVKEYINSFDIEAGGFEPTEEMIKMFLSRVYNEKNSSKVPESRNELFVTIQKFNKTIPTVLEV